MINSSEILKRRDFQLQLPDITVLHNMSCLPTISFIRHHAFFIVHAHSCVFLNNMKLFRSHCIGLYIRVAATLTQLDSCVIKQCLVTNPTVFFCQLHTHSICLKATIWSVRHVYEVGSPQGSTRVSGR